MSVHLPLDGHTGYSQVWASNTPAVDIHIFLLQMGGHLEVELLDFAVGVYVLENCEKKISKVTVASFITDGNV